MMHVAAPERIPQFRTAVRGYCREAVDDAVVGLTAQGFFLQRSERGLEDELRETQELLARKQLSKALPAGEADNCSELTAMIEAILRPAQIDSRRIVEEANLFRTSARAEAEEAADGVRESADQECARAVSSARARAEQTLSAARAHAERTMSAAAARESGAAQEAHRFLEEAKQAMVRAAADNETTLNAWCSRQAAEIDARQTEHDKWLGECQQTAAEAERLSIQLPQEAERKAQAILDAAQEQIAAIAEKSARLTEFVQHQAEVRSNELREHMEAIHEGIASLGERLREHGGQPASTNLS